MGCKLEELKALMPSAIRDVDYFNHIVIHQNDEIIRLLKKIAGETEEVPFVQPLSLEQQEQVEIELHEMLEEAKPKAKRKKKEV